MKHRQHRRHPALAALCAAAICCALPGTASAQSTAITYQGNLGSTGSPADGSFNFVFTLKDSETGGSTIGTPVSLANVAVANGIFTVSLDFGAYAYSGGDRWLEIEVNNSVLTPRQPLTPTPLALSLPNVWSINGSVGIGTTVPARRLHVAANLPGIEAFGWQIVASGVGDDDAKRLLLGYDTAANQGMIQSVHEGNTQTPLILNRDGGNVGIGTTAPLRRLHVAASRPGQEAFGWQIIASGSGADYPKRLLLGYDTAANVGMIQSVDEDVNKPLILNRDGGNVGIGLPASNPSEKLEVAGNIKCTTVIITSDRDQKDGFAQVRPRDVLDKVAAMPITRWHYKSETGVQHIGPMAQDFHAAFGVGPDNRHITTIDADGIALAAIQGLKEVVDHRETKIKELIDHKDAQIEALMKRVTALERAMDK